MKQEILWLIPIALAPLLVVIMGWLWQRRRGEVSQDREPFDVEAAVRERIEADAGIQGLYADLDFAPWLEWKLKAQIHSLEELIVTTIPDFGRFRNAVTDLGARFDSSVDPEDPALHVLARGEEGSLVRELISAGDDPPRVLALLNQDPVHDALPFLVEIPYYKEGILTWRTPVGVSVIRKGPGDPALFAHRLHEIESLVRTAKIRRDPRLEEDVLDAISRLRRDLHSPTAYFPAPLRALEERIDEWQKDVPTIDKRKQLDTFVRAMVIIQKRFGTASEKDVSESLEEVFAQSRRYLGAPWLQSPGLTNTIVSLVLQVERCRCKQSADRRVLDAIRAEVEAGVYDPEENMRRLRDLEEHGYHVNSLIYSILKRIPDSPTPSGRPD